MFDCSLGLEPVIQAFGDGLDRCQLSQWPVLHWGRVGGVDYISQGAKLLGAGNVDDGLDQGTG